MTARPLTDLEIENVRKSALRRSIHFPSWTSEIVLDLIATIDQWKGHPSGGWLDIDDKAKRRGPVILGSRGYVPHAVWEWGGSAWERVGSNGSDRWLENDAGSPTHYMPLPAPPVKKPK